MFLILACGTLGVGCKVQMGFKDANTSKYDGRSISIDFIENVSSLAPSTLSQTFTEDLREIYLIQSKMNLVEQQGEVLLTGNIVGYDVTPVNITSTEDNSASNRLTIKVKIKCVNSIDPDAEFEQVFSRFADFDSGVSLSDVEDALIEEINDQLTQDIFNLTFGDW